jgi:hypothetical protein
MATIPRPRPTTTIPMGQPGPEDALIRTYQQGMPLGWVRETYLNARQNGATECHYDTEWEAVEKLGVHRRMIVDDGVGMTADELLSYMNNYGVSGQTISGVHDNYGYGSKTSLLPWNRYGMIVVSRRDGVTSLLWLHFDAEARVFGVRVLDDGEGNLYDVLPVDEFEEFEVDGLNIITVADRALGTRPHGTAFILLGDQPNQHTILGDPAHNESAKYAIQNLLSNRMFDLDDCKAVLHTYLKTDPAEWPTREQKGRVFYPKGFQRAFDEMKSGRTSGQFHVAKSAANPLAVNVYWTLFETAERPQVHKAGRVGPISKVRGDQTALPASAIKFAPHAGIPEVFELDAPGIAGSRGGSRAGTRMSRFVRHPKVAERMLILFEPVPDLDASKGVWTAGTSRVRLEFDDPDYGTRGMPWDEWAQAWRDREPKPVRDAVSAEYAKMNANRKSGINPVALAFYVRTYASFLRIPVNKIMPVRKSDETGPISDHRGPNGSRKPQDTHNPPSPNPKPRVKRRVVAEGGEPGPVGERRSRQGLIQVVFGEVESDWHPIIWDEAGKTATVNKLSQAYKQAVEFMVSKYEALNRVRRDDEARMGILIGHVESAMEVHVMLSLSQMLDAGVTNPAAKELMGDDAVSAVLYGIRHIEKMADANIKDDLPVISVAA